MSAPALPRTRAAFEAGRRAGLHLGGQLSVTLGGETVADLALGEKRPGEPMTADTLLPWLSTSKPVTAVALAQLWEKGVLELDDPIARHVPEFEARGKGAITLRHALTHTGGFRLLNLGWPEASWQEVVERICQARPEPRWTPGEKAGYHTESSWFILGEVVRRVSGRPFERHLREEVFEPLGMDDCWIGMPEEHYSAYGERLGPLFDTSEATAPEDAKPLGWHREKRLTRANPGANGCGPMRQLGRLYRMLLGRGELDGRRLLSPQTVEALTAPHRVGMMDHTFRHVMDWGLGLIVNSAHYGAETLPYGYGGHASRRTFGHSGRQTSTAFADPVHGLTVALAVNGAPGDERHTRRFRELTEAIYEDLGLAARG